MPAPNPYNPSLPYYECERFDLDYYDRAPVRFVNEVELAATPARLFEIFAEDHAWTVWVKGIAKVEWTSPKPFGVGTTRTVTFVDGTENYELFTAWEEGHEMAFCFVGISKDLWWRFGERYEVTDLGVGAVGSSGRWPTSRAAGSLGCTASWRRRCGGCWRSTCGA